MGWKEYEMEVMRDGAGNGIIVCSIENLDPMGVHTGDSITVAPAQTLSDMEYQRMRVASLAILEKIGVETGGSNVQFAINPENGRMIVIEMNPRVSRSSALASKATGFPIAKAAAKLAVGYTLDEIVNDITQRHACVLRAFHRLLRGEGAALRVREVPRRRRYALHSHEGSGRSDGDRTHLRRGARQKRCARLEDGHIGLAAHAQRSSCVCPDERRTSLKPRSARPSAERIFHVAEGFRRGLDAAHMSRAVGHRSVLLGVHRRHGAHAGESAWS